MVEVQGKDSFPSHSPAGSNAFKDKWRNSQTHYPSKEPQLLTCPECGSTHIVKNGLRYVASEIEIQRYKCKKCRFRFSDNPPNDYKESQTIRNRQLCAILQDAKKLTNVQETKTCAGDINPKLNAEGQILQYLVYMKNQGCRDATLEQKDWLLHRLINLGANLSDPETVKHAIARLERSESYKALLSIAYEGFAKKNGIAWERPKYEQHSPLPFVPHESEIDALISGCSKKMAALLLLLKETAMRIGEAWMIEWTDLDVEGRSVVCNHPEKHSKARSFQISPQLVQMLQDLPKINQYLFNCGTKTQFGHEEIKTHQSHLKRQKALLPHARQRIAEKLKNPRLLKIHYHTFRHYKATQLYHQTRDILYVMKFLGHRDVKNTLIYIDLEIACFSKGGDDFTGKVATTREEKLKLIEAGFEFVSADPDGTQYFRKRR